MNPPRSLSVVLPVYNGVGWVGRSVQAVDRAIIASPFAPAEIVVVDDGSTDATVDEVKETEARTPVRIISQSNKGRFTARLNGLREAVGEFVLFIDSRVLLDEGALKFVAEGLDEREAEVWTADVRVETRGNPIARFWRAIEHIAWRRYHAEPRATRYGIEEFDFFPKGTTAFFCPRELITAAYEAFEPSVADFTKINDDTALLRFVAERQPINIAPQYGCTYHARTALKPFLKHANHRGSVLIDGYLHPGARFARQIALVLSMTPLGVVIAIRHPKLALAGAVVAPPVAAAAAKAKGADGKDALVLGALCVPFGLAYLAGMWRGFLSRLQHRLRARVGRT